MLRSAILFFLLASNFVLARDRITQSIDAGQTVVLHGPNRSKVIGRGDSGAVDESFPIEYATLMLKPADSLEKFLEAQRDPSSPLFHRWLTPEQFGNRFGLSANDLAKLTGWLESQGLKVHDVARGRHWITFSGPAGRVNRAFNTEIHRYLVDGKMHFANATDPSVPAAFQDVVSSVEGLDDFEAYPASVRAKQQPSGDQPDYNSGSSHYLAPDDISTMFNIAPLYKSSPAVDGTGQKIAVLGRTDIDLNDVRLFRTRFGLPANDPQVVLYGPDPGTTSDLAEADIDVQWSGAIARNATIIYVNSRSINTSAQYAVDQNLASVITESYENCEPSTSPVLRTIAQQANAQGITWMVASGDEGATICDRGGPTPQATKGLTVSLPASMPEVTAVGGTILDDSAGQYWAGANSSNGASAMSYIPERAWNDTVERNAIFGTGGGASVYFPKPVWQTGPGVPNDGARDLPDVALPASADHDGYLIYTGGKLSVYGGTSVGTPIFAGMIALANQYLLANGMLKQSGLGNINPTLYRMAQSTPDAFHDITQGDNMEPCQQGSPTCVNGMTGYSTGKGYDLATGLGSVDTFRLVTGWNQGATSVTTLVATPSNPALTDTVQLTATVRAQQSPATPTGTVQFMVGDAVIGSGSLAGSSGVATATMMSTGAALIAGSGRIGALYGGDLNLSGSGGTTSLNVTYPPGQSAVVASVSPNPIYQGGTTWLYSVTLTEKAGVPTTITGFTIGTTVEPLTFFSSTTIPANGSVVASISSSGLVAPVNRVFTITGADANGHTWSQQLTVPFLAPLGPVLTPGIRVASTPAAVQQNPNASAECQWSHQITVQETGGYQVNLTSLTSGSTPGIDIQSVFGTTRLAAYGTLQGTLCFSGLTVPANKTITLAGTSEIGSSVSSSVTVSYAAAAVTPAAFAVAPSSLQLSPTGTLNLSFSVGVPAWTASAPSVNSLANWLTISPASGTGSAAIHLTASGAGLSPGVYNTIVSIQASNAMPQAIFVPVTFTVGSSGATSITGLANGASFQTEFAPGMSMAVFGSDLSPDTQAAKRFPLPLNAAGVSATVNGLTAPLYFVSPNQINLQIPYEAGAGPAVLAVNNNGQIASFPFLVKPSAPGIFASNGNLVPTPTAIAAQTVAMFITGDGDLTPTLATGTTPVAGTALKNLPQPRLSVAVTVGGLPAPVVFVGVTNGLAGATQVNFTVPANTPTGSQPVIVTVGGAASAPVNLTVSN
jgi:uncharacterized protein (TIGR03437 family)